MSEGDDEFAVGDVLEQADVTKFSAGSNVLVIGPNQETMHTIGQELIALAPDNDEGVLVISSGQDLDAFVERFQTLSGDEDVATLSIIDCSGDDNQPAALDSEQVMTVKSMGSLTEIGMSFVQYEDEQRASFAKSRILFDSISALLEHLDKARVFEFVDAFIGRIRASQHLGIWLLDASAHDEETISTFKELFDTIIELRESEEQIEFRVYDSAHEENGWVAVDAD